MPNMKTVAKKVSDALALPPQLQPGVPLVELIGRNTAVITHHCGLRQYTAQCISAGSREGVISVSGSELTVTQMDADTLTVSGRITAVTYAEGDR